MELTSCLFTWFTILSVLVLLFFFLFFSQGIQVHLLRLSICTLTGRQEILSDIVLLSNLTAANLKTNHDNLTCVGKFALEVNNRMMELLFLLL